MRYFILLICFMWTQTAQAIELLIADKARYDVFVPQTEEAKQKGLMFVRELPKNQGMLFDLRDIANVSMWMKNTYIPLDMIFIDCNQKIVDIYEMAEPLSLKKISSPHDFCYVLELNGGEVSKKSIKRNDLLFFTLPY